MNATLLKSLAALVPTVMLLSGSLFLYLRTKTFPSLVQVVGTGCLLVLVLAHFSEALHLFPWMHWGVEQSVGHYLDLGSALLGFLLFPLGYLFYALNLKGY